MVLIALAFVGLAAFIGLAIDAGILFIQIGHLRRAADAASLAAANQFREGRTTADIDATADEFINLNSLNPADANIYICDYETPTSIYHDEDLCPEGGDPYRKFVRVEASMPVDFVFLPIIGWGQIDIQAGAISETASVDLVLTIDTSGSMADDAACDDGDDDDGDGEIDECTAPDLGPNGLRDDYWSDPDLCNDLDLVTPGIQGGCHPFEEVRAAALALVDRMYFPYDRAAVVTFDRNAVVQLNLNDDGDTVRSTIENLTVHKRPGWPGCTADGYPPDPSLCTETNIADGLKGAGNEFGLSTRVEAVWIVILLSDGAANAATAEDATPICPGSASNPTWLNPLCRDEDFEIELGQFGYDTEDAAVDMAYFVGCPNALEAQPAGCPEPGQGAVTFTIGLGDQVTASTACDPYYAGSCEPNQGEELLRFIAGVGDDGDPDTDPCIDAGAGIAESCGNYYFAQGGLDLIAIFEAIASRIFTRITH
jgi:hypothetical protein